MTGWVLAASALTALAACHRPRPRHYTPDAPAHAPPAARAAHHPSHEHPHGPHPHAASDHHHHPHPHPHLAGANGHHHPF
ncbi:MAG TPA: hypothetical protein VFP84_37505 [Kofleriaceae bacterium]|nr:hypothetical protein [Kofleriaceae bacterium]